MSKYSVVLHRDCNGLDVWINFLVNTPLTPKQLKTYYEYVGGLSVSKVEVLEQEKND
jgi:hypothetical protein